MDEHGMRPDALLRVLKGAGARARLQGGLRPGRCLNAASRLGSGSGGALKGGSPHGGAPWASSSQG